MNNKKWIDKAIEMLDYRLIDRGFNVCGDWLGYYDKYCLYYVPKIYQEWNGKTKISDWGFIEIHSKDKVFNPYKYVGGDEYEYEKLGEYQITEELWEEIKKQIIKNNYIINKKKICFDNPYPEPRVRFYQGSDVPISGNYE